MRKSSPIIVTVYVKHTCVPAVNGRVCPPLACLEGVRPCPPGFPVQIIPVHIAGVSERITYYSHTGGKYLFANADLTVCPSTAVDSQQQCAGLASARVRLSTQHIARGCDRETSEKTRRKLVMFRNIEHGRADVEGGRSGGLQANTRTHASVTTGCDVTTGRCHSRGVSNEALYFCVRTRASISFRTAARSVSFY